MIATDQSFDGQQLSPTSLSFLKLRDDVLALWEREVRARVEGARDLLSPVLLNTLPAFYGNLAEALTPSYPRQSAVDNTNTASAHGGERARTTPFGPAQVVEEFQIFRQSIMAIVDSRVALGAAEWKIIDDSINAAVIEAIRAFVATYEDLRKRVAASLSHDMRAPLALIANGAALIAITSDQTVARRGALRIEASARRLSQMVSDLLDALTLRPSAQVSFEMSRFDIYDLVKTVAEEFSDGALNLVEATGDSVTGFWNESAMQRAVENLVSNARKYGDGGQVIIKTESDHGQLRLSVHNNGAPIPKEKQSMIFEYLKRDADSSDASGWGIGLPFVKSVAEGHGGSVAVDSSEAKGTTVIINIPLDSRPFLLR